MQVISSGGIPLALALGVRGYRLRRPGWVVAGSAVAAWQLSIGFTLGLPFAYLLAALAAIGAIVWLRRGRPRLDRGLALATVAGAVLFAAAGFALSRPYLRVADAHPAARRTPATVEAYSGPPRIFLVAPDENLDLGRRDRAASRRPREHPREDAVSGPRDPRPRDRRALARSAFPRWLRRGLGARGASWCRSWPSGSGRAAGCCGRTGSSTSVLPGWQAIRVPGSLVTLSSLGLALLAGAGAQRAMLGGAARRVSRWGGGTAIAAVCVLAIVIEGRGLPFDPFDNQAQPRVPAIPPSTASVPAPQLHLPAERAADNRRYILWSTDGFPELVNGRSSLNPAFTQHLIRRMEPFPDRADGGAPVRGSACEAWSCTRTGSMERRGGAPQGARSPGFRLPARARATWSSTSFARCRHARPELPDGDRSAGGRRAASRRARAPRGARGSAAPAGPPAMPPRRPRPGVSAAGPSSSGVTGSPATVGPAIETTAQPSTAASAGRTLPRRVRGVASAAKTIAVATAASTGATASQPLSDAEHREQGVLERSVAELVRPGAGAVVADQRVGERPGEHEDDRRESPGQGQRRQAPVGRRQARAPGRAAPGSGSAARATRRRTAASSRRCRGSR